MKPTLCVLAAGMGSRYGGLKQVDTVGPSGEAIIDYSIYDAIRAGFGKVVLVIREEISEAFQDKFAHKFDGKIEIEYAYQAVDTPIEGLSDIPHREKPWGTAHAVLVAHDKIHEPFAVINADDYYGIDAFKTMADFLKSDCTEDHWSMMGYVLSNTVSDHGTVNRGVAHMDDQRMLTSIVETLKIGYDGQGGLHYPLPDGGSEALGSDTLVSMNFFGFHPSIFEILRKDFLEFVDGHRDQPRAEFFIPLVVNRLVQEGRIKMSVLSTNEKWYGVTYREDKPFVEKAFQTLVGEAKYPEALWAKL